MLIVIAMIGILSTVILIALGPSRTKAKDTRIISDVNQIRSLGETYYDPITGQYDLAGVAAAASSTLADMSAMNGGTWQPDCPFGNPDNGIKPWSGDSDIQGVECPTSFDKFSVYGKLVSPSVTTYYCVDSSGNTANLNHVPGVTCQ